MIAGASITDERKASGWTFSDGYYDSTQTLTVGADSTIVGFADLSGQTIADQDRHPGCFLCREPEGRVRFQHHLL